MTGQSDAIYRVAAQVQAALDAPPGPLRVTGEGALPSAFGVTTLAAAVIGAAGLGVASLVGGPEVEVDRRLASLWFRWSIFPIGWSLPAPWDAVAGDYRSADGWIRLHTNAPHHRAAALAVLGCAAEREAVAASVAAWAAEALETAVVATGGCAAAMRDVSAWHAHEQGAVARAEPLVAMAWHPAPAPGWNPDPARPLAGLRILDLTRVLAGPVATRFLAGFGAEVLRIDPPDWDEPAVVPEVTLGKRCARLDLHQPGDRAVFERLLTGADALVHGYRPGALDGLGYGEAARRALNPALIDVAIDAYGWTGPWAHRRGFDSLVQMSAGIAAAGMAWKVADQPVPLPVQALDHATGYLAAAAVLRGLRGRTGGEGALSARLSLARTAALLETIEPEPAQQLEAASTSDYARAQEQTTWGDAHRLIPPVALDSAAMSWDRGASALGSAAARWAGG